jgi:hypothetical protein
MADSPFEYVDPSGTGTDMFGPWNAHPGTVSFDVGTAIAEDTPVWRVNLPADPAAAEESLRQAEAQLAASRQALDSVPGKLDEFILRFPRQAGAVASFDVASSRVEQDTPEADLLGLMDKYRAIEAGQVSFGVGEEAAAAWEQARVQFQALMQSINREVLHFAWVETRVDGELVARTTVGWSGDSQTLWDGDIPVEQAAQHARTLSLASASRNLKLRMFTTITTGAAKLSLMLATPAGAVMALPMAYQYVMKVLAQVKEYQALQGAQ